MGRREQERLTALVTLTAAGMYATLVPAASSAHTDHVVFLGTVSRMKGGEGYYPAFRDAFLELGIRVGQPRAFREPGPFLVWRWLPTSALFVAYLALVVLTVWLLARASRSPFAALGAGLFLLLAARTTITEWMLVELWCAPLIAGCVLAWKRERWWLAACLASRVVLIRETAAPLLVAGLVIAAFTRRPRTPWLVAGAVTALLYASHYVLSSGYTLSNGNESSLAGTGHVPESTFNMLTWPLQQEPPLSWILFVLWVLAPLVAWRSRRAASPVVGVLAIPVASVFIDRPYWGLLATPFAVWLTTDEVMRVLSRRRGATDGPESNIRSSRCSDR